MLKRANGMLWPSGCTPAELRCTSPFLSQPVSWDILFYPSLVCLILRDVGCSFIVTQSLILESKPSAKHLPLPPNSRSEYA